MKVSGAISVADRFATSLEGLGRAVAARVVAGVMGAAMILLIWQRVRGVDRRIRGLLARLQAGRLVVREVPRPLRGVRAARVARPGLPRGFGWLLQLVPGEAACFAGQIRGLLAEPEMAGLIAASPQARRVLGPLCRMLGIAESEWAPGVVAAKVVVAPVRRVVRREAEVRVRRGGVIRLGSFRVKLE